MCWRISSCVSAGVQKMKILKILNARRAPRDAHTDLRWRARVRVCLSVCVLICVRTFAFLCVRYRYMQTYNGSRLSL